MDETRNFLDDMAGPEATDRSHPGRGAAGPAPESVWSRGIFPKSASDSPVGKRFDEEFVALSLLANALAGKISFQELGQHHRHRPEARMP